MIVASELKKRGYNRVDLHNMMLFFQRLEKRAASISEVGGMLAAGILRPSREVLCQG